MELHYLRLHRELPCLAGTNGRQEKLPCQKCLGVYFHNQLYPYYCWSSEQSVYYTYQHTMLRSKGRLKCSGLNLPSPGGCGYYCTVSCCHTFVLYLVSLQHKWVCDCEDQWRFWFLLVQTVSLKFQHFLLQFCQFWLLLQPYSNHSDNIFGNSEEICTKCYKSETPLKEISYNVSHLSVGSVLASF